VSINTTIQSLEVFVDTKQRSPCCLVDTPNPESKICQLSINLRDNLGLTIKDTRVVFLNVLDLHANSVSRCQKEASRMMDLIVHSEAPLKKSNNHVGNKADSVFNRRRLSPSGIPSLLVEKALIEHLTKDLIVKLGTIMMEDLRRSDTPPPNLIFGRTIFQGVLIPTECGLMVIAHLDFPLQHLTNDLQNTSSSTKHLTKNIHTNSHAGWWDSGLVR